MTMMQKMRSNQKKVTWFLLVPVVIAFTLFGLGVSLNSIFESEKVDVIYTIAGVKVTKYTHEITKRAWSKVSQDDTKTKTDEETKEIVGECVRARQYGFDVTDAEIDVEIYDAFKGVNKDYVNFLRGKGITETELRKWFEQKRLREKYSNFMRSIIVPTASDIYKKFLYNHTNYNVRYAMIKPADYAADVIVDDDKLKVLYDEAVEKWNVILEKRVALFKLMNSYDSNREDAMKTLQDDLAKLEEDELIRKSDISDGPYADVKFVYVPFEKAKVDIKVEDDSKEVKDFYYSNLSDYRLNDIPTPPIYGPPAPVIEKLEETAVEENNAAKPETVPSETEVPAVEEEKKDEDKDGEAEAEEIKVEEKEKITWEEWDGTEFKTFESVKDVVVKEYIDVKAKEKADEILTSIRNLVVSMSLEKFDFAIIQKYLALDFDGKIPYEIRDVKITPQDAETVEELGCTDLKMKAFNPDSMNGFSYWTHYQEDSSDKFSNVITVEKGKYMFFVINEDKATVKSFEDSKKDIEVAYRFIEERKLAEAQANDIIESLKSGTTVEDLKNTVNWMNDAGTKGTQMYLKDFGEDSLIAGKICDKPIWIEDQNAAAWRIQVLETVDVPDVAMFATKFEELKNLSQGDVVGTRPDQPKGVLGAWQRFEKKLYGLDVEEPEEDK